MKIMKELNIAVLGSVDCGKSTLLSVLKNCELDDGKGLARSKIIKFKHEHESGRTSAVSQHYIQYTEDKIVCLIDLCGHEQYLATTIHGMCGYYTEYAIIVIGANFAITDMTKEHLNACLSLNIPFLIVITKMDMVPKHVIDKTKESLMDLLGKKVKMRNVVWMQEEGESVEVNHVRPMLGKNIPIFCVSNKTGMNIDFLRRFLFNLPVKKDYIEENNQANPDNRRILFAIDHFFNVKGVGNVFSGKLQKGRIEKNDKLFMGPVNGLFYPINIRSFHDNFRNVIDKLECGESGCIAIKLLSKNFEMKSIRHKKGIYLMSEEEMKNATFTDFEADVIVVGKHSTQISMNYQPVINCKKIVQTAKILHIEGQEYIRPGEISKIRFRFTYRPEHIQCNDRFIFREGATRGVGIIRSVGNIETPNTETTEIK